MAAQIPRAPPSLPPSLRINRGQKMAPLELDYGYYQAGRETGERERAEGAKRNFPSHSLAHASLEQSPSQLSTNFKHNMSCEDVGDHAIFD